MQHQTVIDALLDAGTSVGGAAVTATEGDFDTFALGTLLILATARVPVLGALLLGYVVVAAREPETPISGFRDWGAIALAGIRAVALFVGVSLPAVATLAGVGLLDPGRPWSVDGVEFAPNELLAIVTVASLAVAAWHCAVVGLVALAAGGDGAVGAGLRLCRSPAGYRLSLALGGVAVTVPVVAFGLTAVPLIGPMLAAGVIFFGLTVAARLLSRVVADERGQRERLATAVDAEIDADRTRRRTRSIGTDLPDRAE